MTMTLDRDPENDTDSVPGALVREIGELLTQQGFDICESASEDSHLLTIINAPKARCAIDVDDSGWMTCVYCPRAGERTNPVEVSRAVLRMLAASMSEPPSDPVPPCQQIALKGAVGREMRARGLTADLRLFEDTVDFSVYAEVEIANPQQPGRGTVCVTDDGNISWECHADAIIGQAREIVLTLTGMLASAFSCR
jgi:hypothetical protein